MIQLSEHWKKNLSEISYLPRNPSMLKKTDLLNCEICNGKIFLTTGIMNGSFVPCLPILIWSLGRATNRNSRLRKNRIYKFPVFMLSKKRYYIKKRRRYIQMKAHKYWSLGALAAMIGTFYTGYKNMKTAHKYFACSSLLCMIMAIYSGHKMISGKSRKKKNSVSKESAE